MGRCRYFALILWQEVSQKTDISIIQVDVFKQFPYVRAFEWYNQSVDIAWKYYIIMIWK